MRKNIILLTLLVSLVCGCSLPATTVRTVDDRPMIAIKGAPEGAMLFVDGLLMGATDQYNGDPGVLAVEPGTHVVRITANNGTIYEQKIFVESSLKTITVR